MRDDRKDYEAVKKDYFAKSAQPVFSEPSSEPLCCGFATSLWVITFAQLMTLDPLNIVAD